jgi:basic membrane protein A
MFSSKKVLALGLVAVLGFAACGSDDSSSDSTDAAETAASEVESEVSEAATDVTEAMTDDTEAMTDDTEAMTEDTEAGGEAPAEGSGLVCEVTDVGGVDDKGFNQIAFEGLQRAADEFGFTAEVLESTSDADYAPNIQSLIDKDCDLIVTVGFLLGDATAEAAANNPDQQFAIVDFGYEEPIPNVQTLNFNTVDPSFAAGYLAAGMTETGTVATFGGVEIPPVTVFMDGYLNGVNYYNEENGTDVQVLGWDGTTGTFAGNFENLDDGKNIASSFADEGADIIFPVAGPVGLGSSAFATETGGVRIIGVDNDLYISNPTDGPVYLTSVLKKIDEAVFAAVESIVVNGETGGEYLGTLENDGVGLAPYHDQEGDVPAELQDAVTALIDAIIAGEVTTS